MRYALVPDELRHGPFTTEQAAAYGVTPSALRSRPWRNVFRHVWVHEDVPDDRANRFAAVKLVLPDGAFVCGLTAGGLYGIDVQDGRSDLIWVGTRTGRRLRTRDVCYVREITVEDSDLRVVDGVVVTTPTRTVFDCGRWLALVEGVVVADAVAHDGLTTVADLAAYSRSHRALRGVRRLDQVVELMDAGSESPMESRVRVLIVRSGLPRPKTQVLIRDGGPEGRIVARADMAYEELRLAIEYDGSLHWAQRRADDRRRDAMRDLGWEVIVVSREDYYDTPDLTLRRIAAAIAKRA